MNQHNCQTILQPPLVEASTCTVSERKTLRQDSYQSISERRDEAVFQIIKKCPGIAQGRISLMIKTSDSTASKSLTRLVGAGRIELQIADKKAASSPRNFYRVKEYLK